MTAVTLFTLVLKSDLCNNGTLLLHLPPINILSISCLATLFFITKTYLCIPPQKKLNEYWVYFCNASNVFPHCSKCKLSTVRGLMPYATASVHLLSASLCTKIHSKHSLECFFVHNKHYKNIIFKFSRLSSIKHKNSNKWVVFFGFSSWQWNQTWHHHRRTWTKSTHLNFHPEEWNVN